MTNAGIVTILFTDLVGSTQMLAELEPRFGEAATLFRRYTLPWDEADVLHLWGNTLGDAGRDKLEAAIEIYRRIGAPDFWADRVRADLR